LDDAAPALTIPPSRHTLRTPFRLDRLGTIIGKNIMGLNILFILLLIGACALGIYFLLRSLGNDGIEAAAPGSCRSGRCGVTPRPREVVGEVGRDDLRVLRDDDPRLELIDDITRPDARSPNQTL
jgi:hypothetical protein